MDVRLPTFFRLVREIPLCLCSKSGPSDGASQQFELRSLDHYLFPKDNRHCHRTGLVLGFAKDTESHGQSTFTKIDQLVLDVEPWIVDGR